tara:strand:- start:4522 stop:4863 length:342 start_codon:yes stop_codon:yes gene_type:complete
MESNRQKKISRLIQKDLAKIFLEKCKNFYPGTMITITHVFVSKDFSIAKIYLSIFPDKKKKEIFALIQNNKYSVKHALAYKIKNQLRKTPDLLFFIDNSHEHYENINQILKKI